MRVLGFLVSPHPFWQGRYGARPSLPETLLETTKYPALNKLDKLE